MPQKLKQANYDQISK